ncbi:MAG: type II toxin-antitoxin system RelE/ParE family toxin [Anaerolineales bacterium]|nr:type II toxin-antitoxin system RelE/ParE family toxin [Anaerolineales bacterium]
MILSFQGGGTEDIYNGRNTPTARRTCPSNLWAIAVRKLDYLEAAVTLADLRIPPANRLEALAGNRKGQHSIRINQQYRICFVWTPNGAQQVEIVDYH